METLEEVRLIERVQLHTVHETLQVMENALGRELSESEAVELGFDLLEFLDALTGGNDDTRESS